MSEELKKGIDIVLEADRRAIEANLSSYRELLLKVLESGRLSIPIWVEGVESTEAHDSERTYSLLECAGYIAIEKTYGHRNIYNHITLTEKGKALAEKLAKEK
jgi:primosomal replication protein N